MPMVVSSLKTYRFFKCDKVGRRALTANQFKSSSYCWRSCVDNQILSWHTCFHNFGPWASPLVSRLFSGASTTSSCSVTCWYGPSSSMCLLLDIFAAGCRLRAQRLPEQAFRDCALLIHCRAQPPCREACCLLASGRCVQQVFPRGWSCPAPLAQFSKGTDSWGWMTLRK